MLSTVVSVHDVKDVEAFVRTCILKAKIRPVDGQEREELVAEGIAVLLDLAGKFKPHMEGYERPGSFAGYCSIYLPKKISGAWHKWHPEHLQVDAGDGRKRYQYGSAPVSVEERMERSDGEQAIEGARRVGEFVR